MAFIRKPPTSGDPSVGLNTPAPNHAVGGEKTTYPTVPIEKLLGPEGEKIAKAIDQYYLGQGNELGILDVYTNSRYRIIIDLGEVRYEDSLASIVQRMRHSKDCAAKGITSLGAAKDFLAAKAGRAVPPHKNRKWAVRTHPKITTEELLQPELGQKLVDALDREYVALGLAGGLSEVSASDKRRVIIIVDGKAYEERMHLLSLRISKSDTFKEMGIEGIGTARDWLAKTAGREVYAQLQVDDILQEGIGQKFVLALDAALVAAGVENGLAGANKWTNDRLIFEVNGKKYADTISAIMQRCIHHSEAFRERGLTTGSKVLDFLARAANREPPRRRDTSRITRTHSPVDESLLLGETGERLAKLIDAECVKRGFTEGVSQVSVTDKGRMTFVLDGVTNEDSIQTIVSRAWRLESFRTAGYDSPRKIRDLIAKKAGRTIYPTLPLEVLLQEDRGKKLANAIEQGYIAAGIEGGIKGVNAHDPTLFLFEFEGVTYQDSMNRMVQRAQKFESFNAKGSLRASQLRRLMMEKVGKTSYDKVPAEVFLDPVLSPLFTDAINKALIDSGIPGGIAATSVSYAKPLEFSIGEKHYSDKFNLIVLRIYHCPAFSLLGVNTYKSAKEFLLKVAKGEAFVENQRAAVAGINPENVPNIPDHNPRANRRVGLNPLPIALLFGEEHGAVAMAIDEACVKAGSPDGLDMNLDDRRLLTITFKGMVYTDTFGLIVTHLAKSGRELPGDVNTFDKSRAKMLLMVLASRKPKKTLPIDSLLGDKRKDAVLAIDKACLELGIKDGVAGILAENRRKIKITLGDETFEDSTAGITDRMRAKPEFRKLGITRFAHARDWLIKEAGRDVYRILTVDILLGKDCERFVRAVDDCLIGFGIEGGIAEARTNVRKTFKFELDGEKYSDNFSALLQRMINSEDFQRLNVNKLTSARVWLASKIEKEVILPMPYEELLGENAGKVAEAFHDACLKAGITGGLQGASRSSQKEIIVELSGQKFSDKPASILQKMRNNPKFIAKGVTTADEALTLVIGLAGLVHLSTIPVEQLLGPQGEDLVLALNDAYVKLGHRRGIRVIGQQDTTRVSFSLNGGHYEDSMNALTKRMIKLQGFREKGVVSDSKAMDWLVALAGRKMASGVEPFIRERRMPLPRPGKLDVSDLLGPNGKELAMAIDKALVDNGIQKGLAGASTDYREPISFACDGAKYEDHLRDIIRRILLHPAFKSQGIDSSLEAKVWLAKMAGRDIERRVAAVRGQPGAKPPVSPLVKEIRDSGFDFEKVAARELLNDQDAINKLLAARESKNYFTAEEIGSEKAGELLAALTSSRKLFNFGAVYSFDQRKILYLVRFNKRTRAKEGKPKEHIKPSWNGNREYSYSDLEGIEFGEFREPGTKRRRRSTPKAAVWQNPAAERQKVEVPAIIKLALNRPLKPTDLEALQKAMTVHASRGIFKALEEGIKSKDGKEIERPIQGPVLDVGSGPSTAPVAKALTLPVTCVDLKKERVAGLKENNLGLNHVAADARYLPFKTGAFGTTTWSYLLDSNWTRGGVLLMAMEMTRVGRESVMEMHRSYTGGARALEYLMELSGIDYHDRAPLARFNCSVRSKSILIRAQKAREPFIDAGVLTEAARFDADKEKVYKIAVGVDANELVRAWLLINANPKDYFSTKRVATESISRVFSVTSGSALADRTKTLASLMLSTGVSATVQPFVVALRVSGKGKRNGNGSTLFSITKYKSKRRFGASFMLDSDARTGTEVIRQLRASLNALGASFRVKKYKNRGWYGIRVDDVLVTGLEGRDEESLARDYAFRRLLRKAEKRELSSFAQAQMRE